MFTLHHRFSDTLNPLFRLTYHGDDGNEGYHPNLNKFHDDSGEELDQGLDVADPYGTEF